MFARPLEKSLRTPLTEIDRKKNKPTFFSIENFENGFENFIITL